LSAQRRDFTVAAAAPCTFDHSFSLTGILSGKSATLTLNFGFGTRVEYSKSIEIKADPLIEPALLRRLWAEKKIAELSLNELKNKDEITRTGKEYGIVTSNTSLIVLDNLNDYMRYRIIPPKEMQNEYFKQLAAEIDIPYQNLMSLYLRECAEKNAKPNIHWQ